MKRNEQLTAESGLSLQNDVDLLLRIFFHQPMTSMTQKVVCTNRKAKLGDL